MDSVKRHFRNRLAGEKSPYLLQHAANPVDWYPWGPEAFEKAKSEAKPVFLSIGYSTCHWCHVMEKESFENEEIAKLLNENFISIKVDREERPDIDQIYMTAVQAIIGSGGWPLSVFLTPEGKPFSGGTYFPPEDRWGRAGMKTLLPRMTQIWKERREEIEKAGGELTGLLTARSATATETFLPDQLLRKTYEQYAGQFDAEHGGFGGAPKFPRPMDLFFLLRYFKRNGERHALEMAEVTLDQMARGGMYDQLGGGFHRYATDERWLVPHFEKMLYDQALLARAYLEAFQVTRKEFYAEAARDIFQYVLRDMTDAGGGFYSAEDADSEGEEGKFYVWRPEEISGILGPETGRLISEYYGVDEAGNFENGRSILHVVFPVENFAAQKNLRVDDLKKILAGAKRSLFEIRKKRIPPHKDDKILTAWNGLMISALAVGAKVFQEKNYAEAACKAADFILIQMVKNGKLLRRYREGEAAIPAFQEDYAFLIGGLLDLYEATSEIRWLEEAKRFTGQMIRLFWDEEGGGFFYTAADGEKLIARSKEYYDGALPSGNSAAALALIRLARMTGDSSLEKKAEKIVASNAVALVQYPVAYPALLIAVEWASNPEGNVCKDDTCRSETD